MRPEPWHLLVLLLVFLVLFGGKKLPEAARGLGRSLRIFKAEVKEMHDEDAARAATRETGPLEGRVLRPGEAPAHNGSPMHDTSTVRDAPLHDAPTVRRVEPVREPVRSPDERTTGL